MKDIVLFESRSSRSRRESYLQKLAELHRSETCPPELREAPPRKLRWRRSLKIMIVVDVVVLLFALIVTPYLLWRANSLFEDMIATVRPSEKAYQYAEQMKDPDRRRKLEQSNRESEELAQQLHSLKLTLIARVLIVCFVGPVIHVAISWFIHVRPTLTLLGSGLAMQATVTSRTSWFSFLPAVEVGFTTIRGQNVRKRLHISRDESALFHDGDTIWVLYLPNRPRQTCMYGLKRQLAEIVVVQAM